jgi:hypothetical protein
VEVSHLRNLDLDALDGVSGGLALKSIQAMSGQTGLVGTGFTGSVDPFAAQNPLGGSPLLGSSQFLDPTLGLQSGLVSPALNPGVLNPSLLGTNPALLGGVNPQLLGTGLPLQLQQELLLEQQLAAQGAFLQPQQPSGFQQALPMIMSFLGQSGIMGGLSQMLGGSMMGGNPMASMMGGPMGGMMDGPMGMMDGPMGGMMGDERMMAGEPGGMMGGEPGGAMG